MPYGLTRYQHSSQSHFVTFSCYHRLPHLATEQLRDVFLTSLEQTRRKYKFRVYGYVIMPEHVHLLISEPEVGVLATALQALKISVARRAVALLPDLDFTLWQKRYYDHNVRTYKSFIEKLRYIHRNPVARGLVDKPENWKWSSFRHYADAEPGLVEVESQWTADRRIGRMPKLLALGQD